MQTLFIYFYYNVAIVFLPIKKPFSDHIIHPTCFV